MKFITNETSIILFIKGKPVKIEKTDRRYPKILKVFELPKDEQEDAVEVILVPVEVKLESIHGQNGFEVVVGEDLFYKGEKLPLAFSTKVKSIIRDGLPVEHFEKFWENLRLNPSANSINELIDFLSNKELPITDDGHFIAYKGVTNDFWSSSGNKNTKVLTGTTNEAGQIYNGIGEYISVERNQVDDNREQHCSFGLHCGQLSYAKDFSVRTIVVKVNPKDVVSVPSDCSFTKCRICAYEVLSEYVEEIQSSVVDEKGEETIVPNDSKQRNEFIEKIDTYIKNKISKGVTEVTVRQIQNSCSPNYPTKEAVLDALQSLGFYWNVADNLIIVELK